MTDASEGLQGFAAAVEAARADIGAAPPIEAAQGVSEADTPSVPVVDQAVSSVLEHPETSATESSSADQSSFMFEDVAEDLSPNPFEQGQRDVPYSEQFVTVNDEQVSVQELIDGYLRQSDYTRKTQALAEDRKAFSVENDAAVKLMEALRTDPAGTIASLAVKIGLVSEADLSYELVSKLNDAHAVPSREQVEAEIEARARALLDEDPRIREAEDQRLMAEINAQFSQIEQEIGKPLSDLDKDAILENAVRMETMRLDLAFMDLQKRADEIRAKRAAANQSAPQAPGAPVSDSTSTQPSTPPKNIREAWERGKAAIT